MIVSSFSDPIALICPSLVGEPLLQSVLKAFTPSNKCIVMRHSLLRLDRNTHISSPGRSLPGQLSLACSRALPGASAWPPRSPSSWCRAASDLLSVGDDSLRRPTEVRQPTFHVSEATLREDPAT